MDTQVAEMIFDEIFVYATQAKGTCPMFFFFFLLLFSGGLVKIKLELTTLPRNRVVCQCNLQLPLQPQHRLLLLLALGRVDPT